MSEGKVAGPCSGQFDATGAKIGETKSSQSGPPNAPSIILPNQKADYINHIAIDIGGSLIKIIYFSDEVSRKSLDGADRRHPLHDRSGGKLHFVKFETSKNKDALKFIRDKKLLDNMCPCSSGKARVVATGGGAYKFADMFLQELDVVLEKENEFDCLVAGCSFLQATIPDECFTFHNGKATYEKINPTTGIYPYLLVNIGSGVSIIKVDSDNSFTRVSGSSLGGGTFWGLCKLLTGVTGFDELLDLSVKGNSAAVDMLVGDIYGSRALPEIGLSAEVTASSFGKVIGQNKTLRDYDPADIALALCRMISYNIGQLAYMNALRFDLKRVLFGGFFIRGHAYTMETISFAIRFWSQGEMEATFMRHEGYLGAMGAFLSINPIEGKLRRRSLSKSISLRDKFKEVYSMGAPYSGSIKGPAIRDINERVSWVEKFVRVGTAARHQSPPPRAAKSTAEQISVVEPRPLDLHVGVLHFNPSLEVFPLLPNPDDYEPNTVDINQNTSERIYWLQVLIEQIDTLADKAAESEKDTSSAERRAQAFAASLRAHFETIKKEATAYGVKGLAELFEMRELSLTEFGFMDVYKEDKRKENETAMQVLPDLIQELDSMEPPERLLSLIQGVLAANIFDWGARECVAKYQDGMILSIYKDARERLSKRPWRVDEFDKLAAMWLKERPCGSPPFKRVLIFADNAGADIVLGLLPLARELLRMGCEVILAANASPAINDITVAELTELVQQAAELCDVLKEAWIAGCAEREKNKGRIPRHGESTSSDSGSDEASPEVDDAIYQGAKLFVADSGQVSPCLDLRFVGVDVARAASGTELVIIEGMGRAIHTNLRTKLKCDCLKLAMIKNKHVASSLFGGDLFDCVCIYDTYNV